VHELSLARSLLDVASEHAEKSGAVRINRLVVSFGRMSCIEPTALETAFTVTARGTWAEGALLVFEILPAVVYCLSCEKEYSVADRQILSCPSCGDDRVLLRGGTEDLHLLQMEIEQEE
jgi:hydrogenase nickel incorporation protein HypA/HybF